MTETRQTEPKAIAELESAIPNDKGYVVNNCLLDSPDMAATWQKAEKISRLHDSVMILGETGVGKTQLARFIHSNSQRAKGPFIEFNCGLLGSGITESMLFGHVQGAFTGASESVRGVIEQAHGGTLLLNDIDYLAPAQQAKLIGVLDDNNIQRMGEHGKKLYVDFRLLTTTNKDISQLHKDKALLPEFYARINQWRITIPPLRERKSCIKLLARNFLQQIKSDMEEDVTGSSSEWRFESDVFELLYNYAWPGNIRELNAAIRNIAFQVDDDERSSITLKHAVNVLLDEHDGVWSDWYQPPTVKKENNQHAKLKRALELTNGNISKASTFVGLSRTTIHKIIKENGWQKLTKQYKS
jgi:transcriptional regulator with PAS, ATPase and Fis domain